MKIINESLLPNGVIKNDFEDWKQRLICFLNDKTSKFWDKEIEAKGSNPDVIKHKCSIEISFDTPISEFGLYSPKDIKEKIKNIFKNKIPLSYKIIKEIDELEELNENALNRIYEKNHSSEFQGLLDKLIKLIHKKKFNELVLGRYHVINDNYDYREGKIILYLNNIIKCYPDKIKEGFEQTFIHELFHHFHNVMSFGGNNVEEFFYRHDYPSKVIEESLAKFIELNYMKYYYSSFDYDGSMSKLEEHSVSVYPYSGATYIKKDYDFFTRKTYDPFEEFAKIYNMSFNDALYYMVYNDCDYHEYYDVLNHDYDYNRNISCN